MAPRDKPFDLTGFPSGWEATLVVLIEESPVYDGDIPSKNARNFLLEHGFAAMVIISCEESGCCATYKGRDLYCQMVGEDYLQEAIAKRESDSLLKRYTTKEAKGE